PPTGDWTETSTARDPGNPVFARHARGSARSGVGIAQRAVADASNWEPQRVITPMPHSRLISLGDAFHDSLPFPSAGTWLAPDPRGTSCAEPAPLALRGDPDMHRLFGLLLAVAALAAPAAAQTVNDPSMTVSAVMPNGSINGPTQLRFIGPNDFLITEKNT